MIAWWWLLVVGVLSYYFGLFTIGLFRAAGDADADLERARFEHEWRRTVDTTRGLRDDDRPSKYDVELR